MPLAVVEALQTERLSLVPAANAHLADLMEVNADDEVTRFLPYASWRSPDDGAAWLGRMNALGEAGTGRQLVLLRRADDKAIGTFLIFKFEEASARVEIGYVLGRAHWRRGYLHEAGAAVCRHLFSVLGIRRIEAEVNPANTASCGLLEKLGFVHEGTLRQRWVGKGAAYDTRLYGCLADDWRRDGA